MKKHSMNIPDIPEGLSPAQQDFFLALKQNLEIIIGQRQSLSTYQGVNRKDLVDLGLVTQDDIRKKL